VLDYDFGSSFRDGSPLFFIESQNLMRVTSMLPRAKGLLYYLEAFATPLGPDNRPTSACKLLLGRK